MTIKTDNVQIGQNATATQNFTVTQGADGSGKIARGNQGATTQDIITWDAAGKVTFPLTPINTQYSMVRLNTANGYGSTNTMIRRFTNVVTNQGSDITYADSVALGASFTINMSGVYAISYSDQFNSAANMGISQNSSQLSTTIISINNPDIIAACQTANTNVSGVAATTVYLSAGTIIRAHADSNNSGSLAVLCRITITRVS